MYKLPCIYRVICRTTGKSYIGQTVRGLSARKRQHLYQAKSCNKPGSWYNDLNLYGESDFIWEILYVIIDRSLTKDQLVNILNPLEKEFIKIYNTAEQGYNITKGGGSACGSKYSSQEEKKQARKIRKHKKKLQLTEEEQNLQKIKLRNRRKYRKSKLTREEISEKSRKRRSTDKYKARRKAKRSLYNERQNLRRDKNREYYNETKRKRRANRECEEVKEKRKMKRSTPEYREKQKLRALKRKKASNV